MIIFPNRNVNKKLRNKTITANLNFTNPIKILLFSLTK